MADDTLKVFKSFQLAEDATVELIIAESDRCIIGEINVADERYCFNKRQQRDEESFEQLFADLQRLIKTCQFCDTCRDSILRYKILFSIRDATLQKYLLKSRDLTLKLCIDMCRANEKANKHNSEMKAESINKIDRHQKMAAMKSQCRYCGKSHELKKEKCPAFGKECARCHKKNHFAIKCTEKEQEKQHKKKYIQKKKVNCMTEDESEEGDSQNQSGNTNVGTKSEWINKMTSGNVWSASKQVKCLMKIGEQPVNFQIDTGSSVNILPVKFVRNFKETETMLKT